MSAQQITTCLWFNNNAEEAVSYYTSVFKDSKVKTRTFYGEGAPFPKGTVLTITFDLNGSPFLALNGGPLFTFSHAVSFIVSCADQKEIDYYWEKLSEGGSEEQCGWVRDRFGVSWQVVPAELPDLLNNKDPEKSARVMQALLKMKKMVLDDLRKA